MNRDVTPRTRATPGRALAVAFFAATATAVALLASGLPTERQASLLSNLIHPIVAFIAASFILRAGLRVTGRERGAWLAVALGVAMFGAGDATWGWIELVRGVEVPFPGLPDVFYLSGYPLVALGLILLPYRRLAGIRRAGVALDTVIGVASVAILSWILVLRPIWVSSEGARDAAFVVGVTYPIADLTLLIGVMIMAARGSWVASRPLRWLAAALVALLLTDVSWTVSDWFELYEAGSWIDAGWLVSYGLFAAAGLTLMNSRPQPSAAVLAGSAARVVVIPYVAAAALAAVIVLGATGSITLQAGAIVASTLVVLLVVLRQWVSLLEHREALGAERDQLVSVVSHELRTPLTGVTGFLEVLDQEWEDTPEDERRELLRLSLDQARHIARIVGDLITVSRQSGHEVTMSPTPFPARAIVDDALAILGPSAPSRLQTQVSSTASVRGDRGRLTQVIVNLLSNAAKYGGDTTRLVVRRSGTALAFEVHDDGPGVPARYRYSMWETFDRGVHQQGSEVIGSGLGLAIVRSIVEAHGGSVGYRPSETLGGACFWVKVPAEPPSDVSRTPAATSVRQVVPSE